MEGTISITARFECEFTAIGFSSDIVRSKPITKTAKEFHDIENCFRY